MKHILTAVMLLWSSGLQAGIDHSAESLNIRLTGGASRCAGQLQMKFNNVWRPVDDPKFGWNLKTAASVCQKLDCGSALSAKIQQKYTSRLVWKVKASSVQSASALREDVKMQSQYSLSSLDITCSDSVRLVNGSTLCSGRLEVRANQSWYSICKDGFDWQEAEVACREIGCRAPLNFQSELYESNNPSRWRKEFNCWGNESSLLDCDTHESERKPCPHVELQCSEPDDVRLVAEDSHCAGRLEMRLLDQWKPVDGLHGDLKSATSVCKQLNCGLALSAELKVSSSKYVWGIISSDAPLREHVSTRPWFSQFSLDITCSANVKLATKTQEALSSSPYHLQYSQRWK
ncbi:scavenger receptor cysteine-rich type 1 protein M130-like [Cheilinus undulatus]|uniref:scavenger receptor cysteine-rich type 1 protein M130-like n=1 Tax=Cheilinus undulatus TaxID=241271 RepID=UPI001BD1D0F4|nr:scavenger receptor cysteine-rich type 1 protein M130-like [Cheilinus undulatus]